MNNSTSFQPLWAPENDQISKTNMRKFQTYLAERGHLSLSDYPTLHKWSIDHKTEFWQSIVDFFQIQGNFEGPVLQSPKSMPGAKWFPESQFNFAEILLQGEDNNTAIISIEESGARTELSWRDLRETVGKLRNALLNSGVMPGDRVAGFVPNSYHAIVAMLATASIGAIWSSCSPDFGLQGVIDRFGQIQPKVLFATTGYAYNGKHIDTSERVQKIIHQLPAISQIVLIPFGKPDGATAEAKVFGPSNITAWESYLANQDSALSFTPLPFDQPLYIMYSSGTTGVPKCIVHSAGGTLIQHVKELGLHVGINEGDRIFYYTTCGWMMWNWLVSALALKATVVLYDGSPFFPDGNRLFDLAESEKLAVLGSSAKFFSACEKAGIHPRQSHNLETLRTLLSTGSPLSHESFDYIYRNIKSNVCLSSISGGTDILSCFALGNPMIPVYRGELQCAGLGMDVAFYNEKGEALASGKGELVCQSPFPSMPTGFWNDPTGEKYHHAYFDTYPNIWAHGDYGEFIAHETQQGIIIHGRSDAVLNPGGVRIGTAEIYRQVEKVEEVLESVAVGQQWQDDVRIILFVKLREGVSLDSKLIESIKQAIKLGATPRHVPAKILQVPDIPRTISGKIVELAIRNIIHNEPVKNKDALANPQALDYFSNLAELTT